ncbi:hypothetical protein B0H11DRAFT_2244366 [Mycena galericulata]|nr:hypothetical protein B0H11DRAFT_2244366 [Mycena galericulata]
MRIVVEIDDDDEQELADTLFSTLHAIITSDNDHFLDYNDNASSQYLTVEDFTRFVLVPFIAVSLIHEDLAAVETFQEGLFERNNSNEYGEFFFPESDSPEAHEIHRRNMKAIHSIQRDREPEPTAELTPETAPPRHRRAIVKTEPSSTSIKIILPPPKPVIEQEITVQDFTPPPQGKNSKKPVAPKKQLPSKKPKEPKKPSQAPDTRYPRSSTPIGAQIGAETREYAISGNFTNKAAQSFTGDPNSLISNLIVRDTERVGRGNGTTHNTTHNTTDCTFNLTAPGGFSVGDANPDSKDEGAMFDYSGRVEISYSFFLRVPLPLHPLSSRFLFSSFFLSFASPRKTLTSRPAPHLAMSPPAAARPTPPPAPLSTHAECPPQHHS